MIELHQVAEQSLDQILGSDETERDLYRRTNNMVKMFLFSRYPERKPHAKRLLNEMYRTPVTVETVQDGNILFAYLSFNHVSRYILVARYDVSDTFLEEVPDDEERRNWNKN